MVGTKAQSELIPLVEQNSITKNSCNEQFYLFDFSGESNVNKFANPEGNATNGQARAYLPPNKQHHKGNMTISNTIYDLERRLAYQIIIMLVSFCPQFLNF